MISRVLCSLSMRLCGPMRGNALAGIEESHRARKQPGSDFTSRVQVRNTAAVESRRKSIQE